MFIICHQFPERISFHSLIKIPDCIDEGCSSQVDYTFFGPEPAELTVFRKLSGKGDCVVCHRRLIATLNKSRKILKCKHAYFCSVAQGEGEAVSFDTHIRFQNAICRRVIRVCVDRVRPNLVARGWKTQIEDANIRDFRVAQTDELSFGRAFKSSPALDK